MARAGTKVVTGSAKQTLQMWPPSRCIPYARNARIIPDSAVGKVAASIKEFGFKQPIVVDAEGVIIAGHTRLLAAERLGLKAVPVIVASDLTPAQVKAYRLADNRTGQESTWEYELLNIELEELAGLDIDLTLTGFDPDELSGLPLGFGPGGTDDTYTPSVNVPQYEIVGERPAVFELYDEGHADELRAEILDEDLDADLREFLLAATYRHVVFDYRKVAEFYPHASPEVQRLLERSALIIIDYEDAIREGYVTLSAAITALRERDADGE